MRYLYHISFILLASLSLSACCKKKTYCSSGVMRIGITGFNRVESRNLIVKRYEQWNNFQKAVDSATFLYNGNTNIVAGKPDTLWFSDYTTNNPNFPRSISFGNDWQITLPTARLQYRLSAIVDDGHRSELVRCGDDTRCTSEIAHYIVNEVWVEGNTLWISKPKQ